MDLLSESILIDEERTLERQSHIKLLCEKGSAHNLKLLTNVPYDGNCLFSSVLKLMPGAAWDAEALRSDLCNFFRDAQVKLFP